MMKQGIYVGLLSMLLVACGGRREGLKQQLRQEVRSSFYAEKLGQAQAALAHTDSLLQVVEAQTDSDGVRRRVLLDSLRHEADVQGARIRYIHRKQRDDG